MNKSENPRISMINAAAAEEFRVASHPSVDNQAHFAGPANFDFFDVSEEDWRESQNNNSRAKGKSMFQKSREWCYEKWLFVKVHWRAALVIGSLFLILLALFIVAVLLLTLLPRKKDSASSNNVTPEPVTTGPTNTPESSHDSGWVKSITARSYQFEQNISVIDSIVIDSRRGDNALLILTKTQIISLNIVKQSILKNPIALSCNSCKVFDALPQCFTEKKCALNSISYCCQTCNNSSNIPFCSSYGYRNVFDTTSVIQDGVFVYENSTTVLQANVIQNLKQNCQLQLISFLTDNLGQTPEINTADPESCVKNTSSFYVAENLLAGAARFNDKRYLWKANIDIDGVLKLYSNNLLKYSITSFIDTAKASETVLKMKYDDIEDIFLVGAYFNHTFAIARINNDTDDTDALKVLEPLPFKLDITLGQLIDWTFYKGALYVWLLDVNRLYNVEILFNWN